MHTLSTGSIDYRDELSASEHAATLSDERAETVFRQAFNYLATRAKARSGGMGALGFSMGGRLAFLAACRMPDQVRVCVCFYGTGIASGTAPHPGQSHAIEEAESLRASLLFFYGQLDDAIRPLEREQIRERLSKLGKDFRIEIFPEAGHDFFCSDRESYRIHASKVAWEETLSFFRRHLDGRLATSG
jgi:carboxymethylenebutenolidase